MQLLRILRQVKHEHHGTGFGSPGSDWIYMYLSGQEIWCISLQNDTVKRDTAESVASLCGPQVGDQGCEAHIQVWELCQEGLDQSIAVCETVPGKQKKAGRRNRGLNI